MAVNAKLKEYIPTQEIPLLDRLNDVIQRHESFVITTHILPDGDGLGGEMALYCYLKELGKKCVIMNCDQTPEKFSLVDPDGEIQVWDPKKEMPHAEIIFALDVNELNRIGGMSDQFEKMKAKVMFIDHHISEASIKKEHVIDEDISSMGEFLYRFFRYVKAEITFKMAMALYVSIYTDTNVFRHRKTTALSHVISAALVDIGVNPEQVYKKIHQTRSLPHMHLLGEILNHVQTTPDGKIAWVEITQPMQKKYGAVSEDTEGFVDYLLALKEIEIAILFREESTGFVKASFRSKGNIEIFPTVQKLGGGGHVYEAGLSRKGPMKDVVALILKETKALIL